MPVLAADLGGTKAAFAVVDGDGRILARARRPSHDAAGAITFESIALAARLSRRFPVILDMLASGAITLTSRPQAGRDISEGMATGPPPR